MKVFISYSSADKALFDAVAERLRERGDDVIEPSEKSVLKDIADIASEVSGSIRSADAIVAILGGENPNVYFELGLATGANRAVVVATQTPERMPIELKGMPFVQLAGDVLRDAPAIARVIATLPTSPVKKQSMFDSAEDTLRSVATDITALETMSSDEFEKLVITLFSERGYIVVPGHDIGADFAIKSKDGASTILVEVKKRSAQHRVSVEAVRSLADAVSVAGASRGILVATSPFTRAASGFAAVRSVVLKTLDELLAATSEKDLLRTELTVPN